jgi:murein DD-endopeptidase MepM/ murein hydrolase activator NlpD
MRLPYPATVGAHLGPKGVGVSGLGAALVAVILITPVPPGGSAGPPMWSPPGSRPHGYAWPVQGPVLRVFEAPRGPFGPGHRGIDIAVSFGGAVVAAEQGTVAFSGWIAGSLFVSIDHPDGIRTTYSWLSQSVVRRGQAVKKGQVVGQTGHGHPEEATPHLHFGARVGDVYVDPMLLLELRGVAGLIHLAPLAA